MINDTIPILEDVTIEAHTKEKDSFPTIFYCYFKFQQIPGQFYMEVYLHSMNGFSSLAWEGGSIDVINPSTKQRDMGDLDLEIEEHVFEQLVRLILFHSKQRLKLLHYQERAYFEKKFKPGNYKLPSNIIFHD